MLRSKALNFVYHLDVRKHRKEGFGVPVRMLVLLSRLMQMGQNSSGFVLLTSAS